MRLYLSEDCHLSRTKSSMSDGCTLFFRHFPDTLVSWIVQLLMFIMLQLNKLNKFFNKTKSSKLQTPLDRTAVPNFKTVWKILKYLPNHRGFNEEDGKMVGKNISISWKITSVLWLFSIKTNLEADKMIWKTNIIHDNFIFYHSSIHDPQS